MESRVPHDAVGVMAVTMHDLYPKPEWNFVYGLARLESRVAVFSFIRHCPSHAGSDEWAGAHLLHRSIKTALHEIGHMFGLRHCTYYNCLMRGSNGEEVEHQPNFLHLCPVCLRKLHWNIGFDICDQYANLLEIYTEYERIHDHFKRDCDFLRSRLSILDELPSGATFTSEVAPLPAPSRMFSRAARPKAKSAVASRARPLVGTQTSQDSDSSDDRRVDQGRRTPPQQNFGTPDANRVGSSTAEDRSLRGLQDVGNNSSAPAPGIIEVGWSAPGTGGRGQGQVFDARRGRRTRSNSPASTAERKSEEAVKRVFHRGDLNRDGYLSASELETIMEDLGMPKKDAHRLLKSADTDEDGLLDVEEFLTWIFSKNKHAVMALSRITCYGA